MLVLVTGATGFLGRQVVRELLDHQHQVRCLVHTPGRERALPQGEVEVHFGSISDPKALAAACHGVEAVIHLVAIIRQRQGATFDQVNRQGTANVVAAVGAGHDSLTSGVEHFLHVSAIGAANNSAYPYLHSKWLGEQEVVNSGLPYTILRPSLVFGEGDEFLNTLAGLVRVFPLVPVAGPGQNRFQPIAVADVARCLVLALGQDDLKGKTIEIGGPQQLSYNDLVSIVARTLGKRRLLLHIPVWLMHLSVAMMQKLQPRPPVTTDQLKMLPVPNVTGMDTVARTFGFTPKPLESNIDFVRSVSFIDGLRIIAGFMPPHIRDH
jgi:NADH dehydrogenase